MLRFDPDEHFTVGYDSFMEEHYVKLKPKAVRLMGQYYRNKYECEIQIPPIEDSEFASDINRYLSEARKQPEPYRQAFVIGADGSHAIPIIYIKENGKEAIFVADTNARKEEIKGYREALVKKIAKKTGIPVFSIPGVRQSDVYSCFTDALIFGRETTAKDEKGNYRLADLISFLMSHSTYKDGYYVVDKLPDELLITAQKTEKFFNIYVIDKDSTRKIRKSFSLSEHRGKHSKAGKARYLLKKGFDYADSVEIQFYINQIEAKVGKLSDTKLNEFIQKAKEEFGRQVPFNSKPERSGLFKMANEFLLTIKADDIVQVERKGSPDEFKGESKDDLDRVKAELSRILNTYISRWKSPRFGHHYDANAREVKHAVSKAKSIFQIQDILESQKSLFENETGDPSLVKYLGDYATELKNKPKGEKVDVEKSGYFGVINAALAFVKVEIGKNESPRLGAQSSLRSCKSP